MKLFLIYKYKQIKFEYNKNHQTLNKSFTFKFLKLSVDKRIFEKVSFKLVSL